MNPRVDSYIGGGTRVSAMIPPIVREDKGAVASFRKQTKAHISREMMVRSRMAMEEEFELLALCVQNKVSGAVVGATGSGKTTLLNFLMTDYVTNTKGTTRVYIIEESRELQLPDDARVFYTATCGDVKAGNFISAPDLLKSALRFHPTFISCAEMRGEEAMNAMTAAQTGHIVWSTFHADNCQDAYQRLLTMCKMSGTDLSENLLMRNLVHAFPIIVSSQQMKDGSRKITGIFEAEDVDGISVVGHYIYRMEISDYEYDDRGRVAAVHGAHRRVGYLSDTLAQRIFDECGQFERVIKFARPDWMPENLREPEGGRKSIGRSLEF
jgi:pilus assembly protein CpaF